MAHVWQRVIFITSLSVSRLCRLHLARRAAKCELRPDLRMPTSSKYDRGTSPAKDTSQDV